MEAADISGLHINDNEYCTIVGSQYCNSSTFKVKVSKLTPFSLPKGRESFNPNFLVNDPKVKPSVGKSVTVQNAITVSRAPNADLRRFANGIGYIPDGTILKCRCWNGDFKTMTIVDE